MGDKEFALDVGDSARVGKVEGKALEDFAVVDVDHHHRLFSGEDDGELAAVDFDQAHWFNADHEAPKMFARIDVDNIDGVAVAARHGRVAIFQKHHVRGRVCDGHAVQHFASESVHHEQLVVVFGRDHQPRIIGRDGDGA